MRPSLALSIGAVFYLLLGLSVVLAPAQLMSAIGWPAAPNEALVPTRDLGTLLIVLGMIDWLARAAVGPPLRGLLWANIIRPAASMVVNGWEIGAGMVPATVLGGLLVAGFGVDIALIIVFAMALRRSSKELQNYSSNTAGISH
jgi:hypothetical protein